MNGVPQLLEQNDVRLTAKIPESRSSPEFFCLPIDWRLFGNHQFLILHGQFGGIAFLEGAVQQLLGHGVLHLALDGPAQSPCGQPPS